jgi:uncharacterized protein (DUF58 family)
MSGSGNFGTRNKMKIELMAEIGAVLSFSAIKNNDKVGLLLFTDKIEKFIPPKKGRFHVLRVIRELLYFKPESKKTSINSALEYLGKVLKKRSVVFLMSDFMDSNYERLLRILNKRHDIIGVSISDPREKDLTDIGLVEFEDAETQESLFLDTGDDLLKKELAKRRSSFIDSRNKAFRSMGLDSIDIATDKPYIEPLILFFKARAKRFR